MIFGNFSKQEATREDLLNKAYRLKHDSMPMTNLNHVFSPKNTRAKGKEAWRQSLQLAVLVSDRVRTSLGPKGSYKMITYGRGPERVTKITKDPVPMLEEIAIQYPPARIVSEAAKLQRDEAGEGVTQFVILLTGLLRKADELMSMNVHPNIVVRGYLEATKKALEIIAASAQVPNQDYLENVLETLNCNSGFLTPHIKGMILEASKLASNNGFFDKEKIRFLNKPGGSISESKLIKGIVVKKEKVHPNMPDSIKNPKIAILSGRLGSNRLEIKMKGQGPFPINLNIRNPNQMIAYKRAEKTFKIDDAEKIKSAGANVLICEQPLEDFVKSKLWKLGLFGLETVDKKDAEALSKATGAKIVANARELRESDLGAADRLEISKIGLEKLVTFEGCNAATFILRGNMSQTLDELESLIKRSVTVLKVAAQDNRVLPGGGATEMKIARELKNYSKAFPSKEQLAIEGFADVLVDIPRCLAENNGLNPVDSIVELRKCRANGQDSMGIGISGCCENVCFELAKVKSSVVRRAYEVAALMLKIDEQIMSKEIAKFHK